MIVQTFDGYFIGICKYGHICKFIKNKFGRKYFDVEKSKSCYYIDINDKKYNKIELDFVFLPDKTRFITGKILSPVCVYDVISIISKMEGRFTTGLKLGFNKNKILKTTDFIGKEYDGKKIFVARHDIDFDLNKRFEWSKCCYF